MESNSSQIRYEDLDSDIPRFRKIFQEYGQIVFELEEKEYKNFSALFKSYQEEKALPSFAHEVWTERMKMQGLFDREKSAYVFGFLMTEWRSTIHVSVKKNSERNTALINIVDKRDTH